MMRLAVLASGSGSNLESILQTLASRSAPPAQVVLVASNRAQAFALERARQRHIATAVIAKPSDGAALEALLLEHRVDVVVLAGYLKLVPAEVVRRWSGAILNIHPALLPKFGGAGMYGHHVHEAVLAAGDTESGATVHLVTDEYDRGAILAQAHVPVLPGDTAQSLGARVLAAEHELYPRTLLSFVEQRAKRAS
ncbi:MAG: phosphoribosylglycinamide formyltransferase [Gemmatimonadetes bacterium]|nr:phosphoribosylglycinamide formyltransferase [Gemmatimonadota bacterium]